MEYQEKRKMAVALQNHDFTCIYTESGYRASARDPAGYQALLGLDADDATLGDAVQKTLARSRAIPLKEIPEFFHYERRKELSAEWVRSLMLKYGYKTKVALFKYMKSCDIEVLEAEMTITPSFHETLDGWTWENEEGLEKIFLPADSSPADIGAALRLGLERCVE